MKALIDGDVLVYQLGWSAHNKEWEVKNNKGDVLTTEPTKTACNSFIKEMSQFSIATDGFKIELKKEWCNPLEETLGALDKKIAWIVKRSKCTEYQMYISGSTNFRTEVATIKPYKGTRASEKPLQYQEIREYLKTKHEAIVSENEEADDLLGIDQTEDTCICTIDKDLWTVPGWHYDFRIDLLDWVNGKEAEYHLQYQFILGDTVDNIPGINGLGKVKTKKLLEPSTNRWADIADQYRKQYGEDWEESMLEVGRLLYIRQNKGEMWEIPKDCYERVKEGCRT